MLTDLSNIEIINPAISKLLLFCSAGQTLFYKEFLREFFPSKLARTVCGD